MVELVGDDDCCVGPGKAIVEDVMSGLQVERFFHFAIRCGEQMGQHQAGYEQVDG